MENRVTLAHYLATRNWSPYKNLNLVNMTRNHSPFLHRMNFMKKLPVHDGCVNTICWNKTGEYLLSGSDDCNLIITKPLNLLDSSEDYTVLHKVPTRHLGNIFSAQFIVNSGDQQMVSCSSEGPVIVHDINATDPSDGILNFNCHSSTIHEVVTVPDDDKIFLSCGEDKTIRLFDMRVHNSCARSGTCPHPALISNSCAMTTLNLHPLNSNLMLVGRADGLGLVYDRRMLPDVAKFSRERAHAERLAGVSTSMSRFRHPLDGVIAQFSVPDIDEKYRFTSLCYNKNGSEVLASYSGDYVYLFSHDRSSNIELVQTLPKKVKEAQSETASDNNGSQSSTNSSNRSDGEGERRNRVAPKISRIRVRGDWSDTGQNCVPLTARNHDRSSTERSPVGIPALSTEHIAVSFGRRLYDRTRSFVPNIEIIAGPIGHSSGRNETTRDTDESRTGRLDQTLENQEEEDEDGNSTVIDEDETHENDEDEDDDGEFERFAEITVENTLNEAQEHHARLHELSEESTPDMNFVFEDDDRSSNHSFNDRRLNHQTSVRPETKANFRKACDSLKNRYNCIPSYKPRVKYQGHRNSRTSIKEAIFWGDDYVMSGSDCGRVMVWEKETAKLIMGFPADERVVNCLAPNPHHYVLASSGIDYDIKLWSTQSLKEAPLKVSDDEMKRIVENNELMLEESKHTISVPPHLFFRVLASLVRSTR